MLRDLRAPNRAMDVAIEELSNVHRRAESGRRVAQPPPCTILMKKNYFYFRHPSRRHSRILRPQCSNGNTRIRDGFHLVLHSITPTSEGHFFSRAERGAAGFELNVAGETDAEVSAGVISRLYPVLADLKPEVAVFLGDTNTVMGCLAAAQLNIPIVHIEGCMRSYDWRMPEEKYRGTIDHLADIIYTYFDEYKKQGVDEGLNPKIIVVIQNLMDGLTPTTPKKEAYRSKWRIDSFRAGHDSRRVYLCTCIGAKCHIRMFEKILELIGGTPTGLPSGSYGSKRIKGTGLTLGRSENGRRSVTRKAGLMGSQRSHYRFRNGRGGNGRASGALPPDPKGDRAAASLRLRVERKIRPDGAGEISLRCRLPETRVTLWQTLGAQARRRQSIRAARERSCHKDAHGWFRLLSQRIITST